MVVEKGIYELDVNGKYGWMGHYGFVTGYDDTQDLIIYQDTYQPAGADPGPQSATRLAPDLLTHLQQAHAMERAQVGELRTLRDVVELPAVRAAFAPTGYEHRVVAWDVSTPESGYGDLDVAVTVRWRGACGGEDETSQRFHARSLPLPPS